MLPHSRAVTYFTGGSSDMEVGVIVAQAPLTPPGRLASPWSALTSSRSYTIAALRAAAISVFLLVVLIAVIVF